MIIYASRTGNVKYMIDELKLPSSELKSDLVVDQSYFLFTYTDGLGDIPEHVIGFLKNSTNQRHLKGVIASGNTNFGDSFCKAADTIGNIFKVPVIRKIDLRGSNEDLIVINDYYKKLIEGDLP